MKKLILAFICLFLVVPSQARIITVDDDGPADFNNSIKLLSIRTGRTIDFNLF